MKSSVSYTVALVLLAFAGQLQLSSADEELSIVATMLQEQKEEFQYEDFSQDDWTPASSWEAEEDMEKTLLSDIEKALGAQHRHAMQARITENQEGMRPIFQSLAKNEYEKLGDPSVRYLLHRYFVQKHGWFIDGLFTEGEALNSSSPLYTLKDRVPMNVQGLFEQRLSGRGFGLHEIAVLFSVVEDSVHQEAEKTLKQTYKVRGIALDTKFTNATAKVMMEKYMSAYILNKNMSTITNEELHTIWRQIHLYYPTWPRAKAFFNSVRVENTRKLSSVGYADMANVIVKIIDSFGIFMGRQCQDLKQQMTALEGRGSTGCVPLDNFYGKGLKEDSNWLFVESPEYLRHIGALDETDPKNPSVLMSNYITSPNSCLQPSGYYMVCCHNECDDILGFLERGLTKPSATPKEIVTALPASLKSGSLRATSKPLVPEKLLRRLEEVAFQHEGQVPIHGRLFAQWLHHVYPRECPYPHVSGTRSPEWMEDFESETGRVSALNNEEMTSYLHNRTAVQVNKTISDGTCAPWLQDEELFAALPIVHRMSLSDLEEDPHLWLATSSCALLAVVATMTISVMRMYRSMMKSFGQAKPFLV